MTKTVGESSARSTFYLLIQVLFLLGSFVLPLFHMSPSQAHATSGGQTKFSVYRHSTSRRWAIQVQLPGAARNRGVCGLWTRVLGASS